MQRAANLPTAHTDTFEVIDVDGFRYQPGGAW